MAKTERQVDRRQRAGASLGPLHQDDRPRLGETVQAEPLELTRVGNAIKIQVEGLALTDVIALDKTVGRALYTFADAERTKKRAGERRLARTEVTVEEGHEAACWQDRREATTQRHGGLLVRENQLDPGAHASSPLTRRRSGSSRSPARSPRSPARAATSPARACSPTPRQAAS